MLAALRLFAKPSLEDAPSLRVARGKGAAPFTLQEGLSDAHIDLRGASDSYGGTKRRKIVPSRILIEAIAYRIGRADDFQYLVAFVQRHHLDRRPVADRQRSGWKLNGEVR